MKPKGQVVPIAIFIMVISAILILGLLVLALTEIETFKAHVGLIEAGYIADAGIENAIYHLRRYGKIQWQWGRANYEGPNIRCYQNSDGCWATRLNENYRNNIMRFQERLVTPLITIPSAATPALRFCHQLWLADGVDRAYIDISSDGGFTWQQVGSPFTTSVTEWSAVQRVLPYMPAGSKIYVAFSLESNANLTAPGWYIDNIVIAGNEINPPTCSGETLPLFFFDDCDRGVGNWWVLLKPVDPSPIAFPPGSRHPSLFFVTPRESSTAEEETTWTLISRGRSRGVYNKSEAKISVHGDREPYRITIHYWKRGI